MFQAASSSQQSRNGDNRRTQGMTTTGYEHGHHNHHHHHHRYVQPTKSTESLLLLPKYAADPTLSDSSLSCDCLNVTSPVNDGDPCFFSTANSNGPPSTEQGNCCQQQQNKASQTDNAQRAAQENGAEITRL